MGKIPSETGHAVNLGSLTKTCTIAETLGTAYQPAHPDIQPQALRDYLRACEAAHGAVKTAGEAYDRAVNARKALFDPLKKLATRVVNAYADSGAPAADVEDLRGINRRLQGDRSRGTKDPGSDADGEQAYSNSQRSFINQADLFDSLLAKCAAFRGYASNEADLAVTALRGVHVALKDANTLVDMAAFGLRQARRDRDRLFYDAENGLVARGKRARTYARTKGGPDPFKGIQFRSF